MKWIADDDNFINLDKVVRFSTHWISREDFILRFFLDEGDKINPFDIHIEGDTNKYNKVLTLVENFLKDDKEKLLDLTPYTEL